MSEFKDIKTFDQSDLKPWFRSPDSRLAEGITYINETDTLYWIDILKGEIHRLKKLTASGGEFKEENYNYLVLQDSNYVRDAKVKNPGISLDFNESVGVIFPDHSNDNIVLFGSRYGIGRCDLDIGTWEYILLYSESTEVDHDRVLRLRSNDGNISPCGKYIYIGLMNDFPLELKDEGCVLKIDLNGKTAEERIKVIWPRIKIPNAIHWNADGSLMYLTDSLSFTIWEYNESENTKKKLIDIKKSNNLDILSPEPDGSAVDISTGLLYTAVWSTRKVQVYQLKDGKLVQEILLPNNTPRISCCCIVGNDLFVTTGNMDTLEGEKVSNDTVGGCIYRVRNIIPNGAKFSSKVQLKY
ncbi:regucalcin NDAI_0A06280 [Naumovozyma dairenensis CBS 421]|uniref:SMP-30/Gluconolactonase/LRE-like region domain-containing protein n=1 Tax=Naumovozyma dairenensis (strain ATCC 10597 / BCRC 20456 / CBS 421 / NBRC 0211 / NRRL Y-12639) TaxID=1071378 RepID=G0W4P4_NAUDC|nr:hypothetical protein NDAI_0A06280 [Naumovozyma dairenensis CBS 421]CCD22782.1 hypothetical protein NDAI_0A06280 [Naumovozyma dairenensis CBS 421]